MRVVRCEDCKNCIGHTCDVYFQDKEEALKECFKEQFKHYEYEEKKKRYGINFR